MSPDQGEREPGWLPYPGTLSYTPSSLTFDQLRTADLLRLRVFPGHESGDDGPGLLGGWTYNDWMVALTGEVGELANLLKKRRRGWVPGGHEDYSPEAARMELADIAVYLDLLAACLGVDLGDAVRAKFNIVSERINCNVRL